MARRTDEAVYGCDDAGNLIIPDGFTVIDAKGEPCVLEPQTCAADELANTLGFTDLLDFVDVNPHLAFGLLRPCAPEELDDDTLVDFPVTIREPQIQRALAMLLRSIALATSDGTVALADGSGATDGSGSEKQKPAEEKFVTKALGNAQTGDVIVDFNVKAFFTKGFADDDCCIVGKGSFVGTVNLTRVFDRGTPQERRVKGSTKVNEQATIGSCDTKKNCCTATARWKFNDTLTAKFLAFDVETVINGVITLELNVRDT